MTDRIKTVTELFDESTPIDEALQRATRETRRFHKTMGNPMATWRDGRFVWIQPADIVVDYDAAVERSRDSR